MRVEDELGLGGRVGRSSVAEDGEVVDEEGGLGRRGVGREVVGSRRDREEDGVGGEGGEFGEEEMGEEREPGERGTEVAFCESQKKKKKGGKRGVEVGKRKREREKRKKGKKKRQRSIKEGRDDGRGCLVSPKNDRKPNESGSYDTPWRS